MFDPKCYICWPINKLSSIITNFHIRAIYLRRTLKRSQHLILYCVSEDLFELFEKRSIVVFHRSIWSRPWVTSRRENTSGLMLHNRNSLKGFGILIRGNKSTKNKELFTKRFLSFWKLFWNTFKIAKIAKIAKLTKSSQK